MKIVTWCVKVGKDFTEVSYLQHFFSVTLREVICETRTNVYFYIWLGS